MIRVDFAPDRMTPQQREWLRRWELRARRAYDRACADVAAGRRPDTDAHADVWRSFKEWLAEEFFARKCAYCEGRLGPQTRGEGEHWRPKAGVRDVDADGRARPVIADGVVHPGYWWLAFASENLVPACNECNRQKGTRFPVAGDRVFEHDGTLDVDALDALERPLLLHPYRGDDPADHIGFRANGMAYAKRKGDKHADATITVLDLNRWELLKARVERIEHARDAIGWALAGAFRDGPDRILATSRRYEGRSAPYSKAVSEVLAPIRDGVAANLQHSSER